MRNLDRIVRNVTHRLLMEAVQGNDGQLFMFDDDDAQKAAESDRKAKAKAQRNAKARQQRQATAAKKSEAARKERAHMDNVIQQTLSQEIFPDENTPKIDKAEGMKRIRKYNDDLESKKKGKK